MLENSQSLPQALEEVFVNPLLECTREPYPLPIFVWIDQVYHVHGQWHNPPDVQCCGLIPVCCGGILGLGESEIDHQRLLAEVCA